MKKMINVALAKMQGFLLDESGSAQKSLRLPVVGFVLLLTAGILFLTPKEAWACKPVVLPPELTCTVQILPDCCTFSNGYRARWIRKFCPDGNGGYTAEILCTWCENGGFCST